MDRQKQFEETVDAQILKLIRDHPGIDSLDIWHNTPLGTIPMIHLRLYALEESGQIASQQEPGGPERGGRPRSTYHLRKPID